MIIFDFYPFNPLDFLYFFIEFMRKNEYPLDELVLKVEILYNKKTERYQKHPKIGLNDERYEFRKCFMKHSVCDLFSFFNNIVYTFDSKKSVRFLKLKHIRYNQIRILNYDYKWNMSKLLFLYKKEIIPKLQIISGSYKEKNVVFNRQPIRLKCLCFFSNDGTSKSIFDKRIHISNVPKMNQNTPKILEFVETLAFGHSLAFFPVIDGKIITYFTDHYLEISDSYSYSNREIGGRSVCTSIQEITNIIDFVNYNDIIENVIVDEQKAEVDFVVNFENIEKWL